jgi:DNA polymerase (family 10)
MNASMYRLDLNDAMARAAQEAGAFLAIGSDAHSTAQLDHIRYGVFQARRGWIQEDRLLNIWPWASLNRWLEHKTGAHRKQTTSKVACRTVTARN